MTIKDWKGRMTFLSRLQGSKACWSPGGKVTTLPLCWLPTKKGCSSMVCGILLSCRHFRTPMLVTMMGFELNMFYVVLFQPLFRDLATCKVSHSASIQATATYNDQWVHSIWLPFLHWWSKCCAISLWFQCLLFLGLILQRGVFCTESSPAFANGRPQPEICVSGCWGLGV